MLQKAAGPKDHPEGGENARPVSPVSTRRTFLPRWQCREYPRGEAVVGQRRRGVFPQDGFQSVIGRIQVDGFHAERSWRSLSLPRARWVFTVPSGQPATIAISG